MEDRKKWLEWRHKGIGSSDAAAIHGLSPYMTKYELWEKKMKPEYIETPANFAQEKGIALEPIARMRFAALYNLEHGTEEKFEPKLVEMVDFPFMKASLDGATRNGNAIIEIKFQGKVAHTSSMVRPDYFIQIQHQALISGAKKAYLVSFDGSTINYCEVLPDPIFMEKHLMACIDFWSGVRTGTPPPFTDKDYKALRSVEAKTLVSRWKDLKSIHTTLEKEIEEVRSKIIELCTHPRIVCEDVHIVKYPGKRGSIDYSKIDFVSLGIDVEQHRKPDGKEFWKFEVIK